MTKERAADLAVDVQALGVTVRILVPSREMHAAVERSWGLCLAQSNGGSGEIVATVTAAAPDDDTEDALARAMPGLTQQVTAAAIRARTGSLLMFHAGALCDQETGATIAVVAPGGTGKTTVVRTLGPGRGYLTDETVGVKPDGSVVPYAKPLSVRRPDAFMHKDEIPPDELGLELPRVDPWLAALVVLRRDLDRGEPVRVERVDLLEALVALAPETSSLAALDRPLRVLADLVERVGGLRILRYHDAEDLEPVVAALLLGAA
ncbi:hypothetical protein GCM10027053_33320 [Intrasporangium mesophilum]